MLGKTPKPAIGILTGSLVSSKISKIVDVVAGTRTHLEPRTRPKGLKRLDFGGVGLGIVAALEKSGGGRGELPAKPLFSRSDPIPVITPTNSPRSSDDDSEELTEMGSSEEYTIVTCHGPSKSYKKVFFNGIEHGKWADDRTPFRIQQSSNLGSVFHISPATYRASAGALATDFLSSCCLCQKQLHGEDIYMYRGEKAFCSTECRHRQIRMDERKEKCRSEASRAAAVAAGSPLSNDQFLAAGILAI